MLATCMAAAAAAAAWLEGAGRKHVNLAVITVAQLAPRICGSAISASKLLIFQGPCPVLHDVTLLLKG